MTEETTPAAAFSIIGTRPARYDAADKATGRARFGPDIQLPGMLHGKVLRSPYAHARIRAIDTRDAEALPGVYAVVTAADLQEAGDRIVQLGEGSADLRYLCDNTLAHNKVLYVGHPVAAVTARTPHIAEEALERIKVEYEVLPPVLDVLEAACDDAPLLHADLTTRSLAGTSDRPSNVASHFQHVYGDPAQGFAQADVIVERTFRTATVHQGYIEPHAAVAVWGADGDLAIYTTTQGSFAVRDHVAELLRYPMSKIRVIPTEVGGAFGGKNVSYLDVLAALLSRKSGRPVKMVMTRAEVLLATGPSSGTAIKVKMGATREGRITAAQATLWYEAGAYPGSPVGSGGGTILGPYAIPNGRIDGYDVVVNKPRIGSYRAPGATPASFAGESVIDELACKLDMDPIEFRLLNCAQEGTRRVSGGHHTEIHGVEVLRAAQAHPHYRASLPGAHCGRGVAFAFWGNWGAESSSTISVNGDGTVSLTVGSVDITGTRTSLAMQVAETLGLALDQVRPTVGDTATVGFAEVSAGSRTTMATGVAVVKAAHDVIDQLRARAALLWEVPVEQVAFEGGALIKRAGAVERMSFRELAAQLPETGGPVTGVGNVNVQDWGGTFGAHIADVHVDPETGKVTVLRYTAVQDVGRAIHPAAVEGQIQGGTAQGIGWALYEGYAYDANGLLRNPSLLDYKQPTALDVPAIEVVIVEDPYPKHPFGVRGVGETPIVPPPAAIAAAIYRATGARVEELPMTPTRILKATGAI
jgi:xanthine dehydrogenase molybdenum-binding subunit